MKSITFLGDAVWPADGKVDVQAVLPQLASTQLVVNLEGPLLESAPLDTPINNRFKSNLHSSASFVEVLRSLNVAACSLANNHINDYEHRVTPTADLLRRAGIQPFGTAACPTAKLDLEGIPCFIVGAVSPLPEPKFYPGDDIPYRYEPRKLLKEIRKLRQEHPGSKIVCFIHWGYELATAPEPADREWAHKAIDAGADYIIGHHSHVVQGIEWYHGGMIAYSLGNFIMPQGKFHGQTVRFLTNEVLTEMGIEITREGVRFHWFQFDKDTNTLRPLPDTDFDGQAKLKEMTPYAGLSHAEYNEWFRKVGASWHLSPRRGGPTYRSYFGPQGFVSMSNDFYMKSKRQLRKWLMSAGLHKPYNW